MDVAYLKIKVLTFISLYYVLHTEEMKRGVKNTRSVTPTEIENVIETGRKSVDKKRESVSDVKMKSAEGEESDKMEKMPAKNEKMNLKRKKIVE